LGGAKKIWGTAPECIPVSVGLGRTVTRKSSIGGFMFVQGVDILQIFI